MLLSAAHAHTQITMETRTALQILLLVITLFIVGLGGLIAHEVTREAETTVVTEIVTVGEAQEEYVNPWSLKGDAAISLVQRVRVEPPLFPPAPGADDKKPKKDESTEPEEGTEVTVGEVVELPDFATKVLKVSGEPVGWRAQWWGETKFGPSYFLIRYAFKDADILIGPAWLVDLRNQTVVPKNLPAIVAENPKKGMESDYYDKKKQIVSAIAKHRFEKGMSLAGALLVYFERKKAAEGDTIEGWSIDHDRGSLFRAYFQWVENGEPTYAEFEFDFDAKALKPVNLQAANIMRVGEDFDKKRVSIMPASYDPKAGSPANRWKGAARNQCREAANRNRCKALATILDESEVIESLEWLLTARSEGREQFEECKEARVCSWRPVAGEGKYTINYVYKLGDDAERTVQWEVDLKTGEISPSDRISTLAFNAIRPR